MAWTDTTALTWDKAAWDRLIYFAFRAQLHFDSFATVKPTNQTTPGSTVNFTFVGDLNAATTPLNESTDVDPVAISESNVQVTLAEYGNAVIDTAKLRAHTLLPLMPTEANLIGWNAGVTMDTLAANKMILGTNVRYAGTAGHVTRNTMTPVDVISSHLVRLVRRDLRSRLVPDFGGYYTSVIHPDVSLDLREETGSNTWRLPKDYVDPQQGIYQGEIGEYEGFRFIETPTSHIFTDGGSSPATTDVYATLFFGQQALAKAYATQDGYGAVPQMVVSPVTDKLRRFTGIGWKHIVGYKVFRDAALTRVESASTVGAN